MAGNIYGYQGVHTPLESVTQGRYTLSDYTSMRTELTSRLIALENQGGFVPTNVEITGYLHMLPGGAGMGEIETTSSITGDSLYINTEVHCGNLVCDNTAVFGGNVTINGGSIISGNGSGLTNINDITKVPLSGGTMSGSLTLTAPAKFIGDGSLLTGISSSLATNLSGGAAGQVPYQSGVGTTLFSAVGTAGQVFTSQGAGVPTWTTSSTSDPTKLPLTGGTMTGPIGFTAPACAQNYKQNYFQNWATADYTPFQLNPSTHDCFRFTSTFNTILRLTNNGADNLTFYQDGMRIITIIKPNNGVGGYSIQIFPPTGYLFYYAGVDGGASYTMAMGDFSVTFMLVSAARNGTANGQISLISKVA